MRDLAWFGVFVVAFVGASYVVCKTFAYLARCERDAYWFDEHSSCAPDDERQPRIRR